MAPPPSECGKNCSKGSSTAGFRLFGVQIDIPVADGGDGNPISKSNSTGNLESRNPDNTSLSEPLGYMCDALIVHKSFNNTHSNKKGSLWSEEEHRAFLAGLERLGKGDWKGIATRFVPTRTSSQVASHAQKYFIWKAEARKRRRGTKSIFDIPLNDEKQSLERPPLSPKRKRRPQDLQSVTYTPRSVPLQAVMAGAAWVPIVQLSSQNSEHLPGAIAAFVPNASIALMVQKGSTHQVPSIDAPC